MNSTVAASHSVCKLLLPHMDLVTEYANLDLSALCPVPRFRLDSTGAVSNRCKRASSARNPDLFHLIASLNIELRWSDPRHLALATQHVFHDLPQPHGTTVSLRVRCLECIECVIGSTGMSYFHVFPVVFSILKIENHSITSQPHSKTKKSDSLTTLVST